MAFNEREFERALREEAIEEIDAQMDELADEIFEKSQELLDEKREWISLTGRSYQAAITDTGFLAASGEVIKEKLKKIIKYDAPHSAGVEFGMPPHFVSPEDLVPWVHRKLGVKQRYSLHVAKKIAKFISEHGSAEKPFMRPALNSYISRGVLRYENGGMNNAS